MFHSASNFSRNSKEQTFCARFQPHHLATQRFSEGKFHQAADDEIAANFPGGQFALHSVSEHHDVALMEWQLILADGTPGVRGHDAIRVTPEGKFGHIVTFAPSTLEPRAS